MADLTIIQGLQTPIDFDATAYGTINAFQVELKMGNNAVLKWRYPTTTGYQTLTKVGNVYTAIITTADCNNLLGVYGVELTGFVGTVEVGKSDESDYLEVKQQSK